MKITIEEIGREREEELILKCYQLNDDILNLLKSIKAAQNGLVGMRGEEIHRLSLADIYYFEVVDSRSSKSMVLNSDKIDSVTPSLSGRFEVRLLNQEKVIVSRQYVGALKKLMGL